MIVAARVAAVKLVRGLLPGTETARLLGISPRSVRRMARRQVDDRLRGAIQQQMALRYRVALQARQVDGL